LTTLADVAELFRSARRESGLNQLELAQRAGVSRTPVAKTRMSEDGRLLVVDRFDVDAQGIVAQGI